MRPHHLQVQTSAQIQTSHYNLQLSFFQTVNTERTEACTHFIDSAGEDHPHLTTVFLWDALQHQLMGGVGAIHANTSVQREMQGL